MELVLSFWRCCAARVRMATDPHPSDVTDEDWEFAAPYMTLVADEAPLREHDLREAFNGLRWVVRTGAP